MKPPAGQDVHEVAPTAPLVSELAVQLRQAVEPTALPRLAYVLIGHAAQSSPRPSEMVPAAHDRQSKDELRPPAMVAVPAGQAWHDGEPAAVL